jgi:hypothetical protein
VQVITAPTVRLDLEIDRKALDATIARLAPRLLVLDPFVRLHRVDENASGEVAPLLAYPRELQRRHGVAVIVVHHAKKGAARARAGQALRGSSEFHAWGDSNLYLRREGDALTLTVEHRAAPSPKPMRIELVQSAQALALQLANDRDPAPPLPSSLDERIASALADAASPIPFGQLRSKCRVRATTLYERLLSVPAILDGGRSRIIEGRLCETTQQVDVAGARHTIVGRVSSRRTGVFPVSVSLRSYREPGRETGNGQRVS